jgi:DNA polymerase II small subunit
MSDELTKAVSIAIKAGHQIENKAFNFLKTVSETNEPVRLIEETIRKIESFSEKPLFITRELLEEIAREIFFSEEDKKQSLTIVESKGAGFCAYAKEVDADVEVIKDPTGDMCGTESIADYLEYFKDRFRKVRRILKKRIDARDALPLKEALKAPVNSKVKIIGMITEKRESKQKILLRIEDLEINANVIVSSRSSPETLKLARTLLLDQVICIKAIKWRNNLLIAEEFILPDMPRKKPHVASVPVYAALISDLHVGSNMFMEKEFNRFILWLNGKLGNGGLKNIASHVKYVVIAGDLVDGIGVYPGQIEELAIRDIYKQYKMVSELIGQIPDYIEIIVIPGNHDASRKALPQPAIYRDYAKALYEDRKVYSLGNPCTVRLHGVELLLYHGRSLDDLAASVPNVNFHTPHKAMRILLKSRHLSPIYGKKTPIAPDKRDFMVIDRIPDIFHAGHVHVMKHEMYRGILVVNSGTWQMQTKFQKRMGLTPTPGIAPIVDLHTLKVTPIGFSV